MSDTLRVSNLHFGNAASNYNQPQMGFTSVGVGSTSNYGFLQFFGTSNTLCWTANGTVGIGTTAPTSTLQLYAASTGLANGIMSVFSSSVLSGTASSYDIIQRWYETIGVNLCFVDLMWNRGITGSDWQTASQRFQAKIDLTWQGFIEFNGPNNNYGVTIGAGSSTSNPNSVPGILYVKTGGNVGIGVNPQYKFQVVSGALGGGQGNGFIASTTPSTVIGSFLRDIAYVATDRVDIEIGGSGTGSGNLGNVYKYRMGVAYSNSVSGGNFQISSVACNVSTYTGADTVTPILIVTNNNRVGIGSTDPLYTLDVAGSARLRGMIGYSSTGTSNNVMYYWWSGSQFAFSVDNASFFYANPNSDYRIKENIQSPGPILSRLCAINMIDYELKTEGIIRNDGKRLGVFAHELQESFPEYPNMVIGAKDEVNADGSIKIQSIAGEAIGYLVMKSVQELAEKLTSTQQQLIEKSAKLDALLAWAQTQGFSS